VNEQAKKEQENYSTKPKSGRGIRRTSELPNWSNRPARGALEAFSSPSLPLPPLPSDKPARFQTPSRLETLGSPFTDSVSRIARSVHDRVTTRFNTVDTTHNYSELNSSTSSPSTENQEEDREQEAVNSSASSGYSPGGSSQESHEPTVDPDTNEGRYLFGSFTQGDLEEEQEEDPNEEGRSNDNKEDPDLPESTPSPVVPIKTKMAPVNFDPALEHFVVHLLKVKLTHEIAYALDQTFVNTFDEFRSTDPVDVHTFTYKLPGDTNANGKPLHMMLVKQVQGGIYYC
jgi:hypothetical protein